MKFGLGTAQFGMPYGLGHRDAPVWEEEAKRILRLAWKEQVRVVDTAGGYGNAEQLLAEWLPEDHPFQIVTKIPSRWKRKAYGVLAHSAARLLGPAGPALWHEMESMGAEKIGASIYSAEMLETLLDRYPLQIVQLPLNVLDQRLSGWVRQLKEAGIEVHVRSVFNQGALLMKPEALPAEFDAARDKIRYFQGQVRLRGLTPLEGAIAYVREQNPDVAVFGVTREDQLKEIIAADKELPPEWCKAFALDDEEIPQRPYGQVRAVA